MRAEPRGAKSTLLIVFFAGLGMALLAQMIYGSGALSYDGVTRIGVGVDLFSGLSRGRQGFVGSLYWAPLPTLLMLPLLPWPFLARTGLAAGIVAAASLAGACAFLSVWWAMCRVPRLVRIAGVALLCACPWIFWSVAGGESSILFAFLTLASVALTIRWLEARSLRSLAYLAVLLGLLVLTRSQSAILVLAVFLLVALCLILRNPEKGFRGRRSYAEATLIVLLAPVLYAFLVWLAANWLIMGDATFFLRGLFPGLWPHDAPRGLLGWLNLLHNGGEWPVALAVSLLVGLPWLGGALGDRTRPTSSAAAAAVLIVSGLLFAFGVVKAPARPHEDPEVSEVMDYLTRRHSEDAVVIAGYRGYDLIRRAPQSGSPFFFHTANFDMGSALHDTRGRRLYILVHRPVGSDRWEDIQLQYPEIFEHGVDFTVFEKGWENWQLLEVVRMD